MIEKQKVWLIKKTEKIEAWFNKNKVIIGFGAGMATMALLSLLAKKIDEPKEGIITFTQELTEIKPNIIAHVCYQNRFGVEKNVINIRYHENDPQLKALYDNLGTIMYPGD